MKKLIALLLGLGLVVGSMGCENKPKPPGGGTQPTAGGGGAGAGATGGTNPK